MPATYPLSLPGVFKSAEITITAENVVSVWSGTYSLIEQVYESPGKRWHVAIKLPSMSAVNSEQVVGWMLALRGKQGTFYCNDTSHRTPFGVATGTPLVNGAQTAGSTDLAIKGWTPSITGILKAGDWLQVGTGSTMRLHKVCFDVNSDSSGHCTAIVWPTLRSAYADGTTIVTTNASGVFYLKQDLTYTINLMREYGLTLSGVEALSLS